MRYHGDRRRLIGENRRIVRCICTRFEKYSSKLDISRSFIRIFETNPEDTFTRFEKYSSKLNISRSFIRIFETNLEDTFARLEKYLSKLNISRSLFRIFAARTTI